LIVLPTGAGKSLVIAELARIARGRVLVLAHVKELVEQNHAKYRSYGLEAGIYSAGLNRRDSTEKVIFGGIQSVARAEASFFEDFSLLIIDECHRVSFEEDTQYAEVIGKLTEHNPALCVLGLTATPYRLDLGWIYEFNYQGMLRSESPRFFKRCLYELSLTQMIDGGYLTPPVQIDAPVASYDFSELPLPTGGRSFNINEIEEILKDQSRVTPVIIDNIIELAKDRKGAILFTSSVRHAKEILGYLPKAESAIVLGDTANDERDSLIERFKAKKIKFLVNVSVLTTGFDAPHVDLIAILRPTESVGLYQQIVGRGLRLSEGKSDCLILDYTGVPHDIFSPQINDRRPTPDAVAVKVGCPKCSHVNDFWGVTDHTGAVVEHFGVKCCGAIADPDGDEIIPCGFRYRYRNCDRCEAENDLKASHCVQCGNELVDNETKIRTAMADSEAHVLRPDTMTLERKTDKTGRERLEVRYYDLDGQHLSEIFFLESDHDRKVFFYNFERMHNKLPEREISVSTIDQALELKDRFRKPIFVIARKQKPFWRIREKIFL